MMVETAGTAEDEAYCYSCSVVCLYSHVQEPDKNGSTDRDSVWGVASWGPQKHGLGGEWIPMERRSFGGNTLAYQDLPAS